MKLHRLAAFGSTRRINRRLIVAVALAATVTLAFASVTSAHGRGGRHRHSVSGVVTSIDSTAASFVVTKHSGKTVTVATTERTSFVKTVPATVAEAVVGAFVVARGDRPDDSSLAAEKLAIIQTTPAPRAKSRDDKVAGTVVSNDGSTLTVDTDGDATADETVTTTADTAVTRTHSTTFAALATGDLVRVKGRRAENGTFVARSVSIGGKAPAPAATPSVSPVVRPAFHSASDASGDDAAEPVRLRGRIASVGDGSFTISAYHATKTVTFSSATKFLTTVDATLANVNAGDKISASGLRRDDGTLVARRVRLHEASAEDTRDGFGDEGRFAAVSGVVSGVDAANGLITVATAKGDQVVAVTENTIMTRTRAGSAADLAVGRPAMVVGTLAGDGSIAAEKVHIDASTGRATRFDFGGDRFRDNRFDWGRDGGWDGNRDGSDGDRDGSDGDRHG